MGVEIVWREIDCADPQDVRALEDIKYEIDTLCWDARRETRTSRILRTRNRWVLDVRWLSDDETPSREFLDNLKELARIRYGS